MMTQTQPEADLARLAGAALSTPQGEALVDELVRLFLATPTESGVDPMALARREGHRDVVLTLLRARATGRADDPAKREPPHKRLIQAVMMFHGKKERMKR